MIAAHLLGSMALLAVSAADASELAAVRDKLDAYLTRIEAVRMQYVERWEPGKNFAAGEEYELNRELPKDAPPEMLRGMLAARKKLKERGRPVTVSTHDFLDAYPSFRHLWDVESTYSDGEVKRTRQEQYVHEGRSTTVNRHSKQVSSSAVGADALLQRTPLNAIGYRLPATLNTRVTELLRFPDVTAVLGAEQIAGFSALHIKIGPGLPPSARENKNPPVNEQTFYELWLDPQNQFAPVRIDEYFENQYEGKRGFREEQGIVLHRLTGNDGQEREFIRYRMEVQEFMPARDLARNESLPFPKHSSFEDGAGKYLWEATRIEINPPITDSDFKAAIPDDYTVTEDGETRFPTIQGGTKGRQQRFEEEARKARDALAASVPQNRTADNDQLIWRFVLPATLALVVAVLVWLKARGG